MTAVRRVIPEVTITAVLGPETGPQRAAPQHHTCTAADPVSAGVLLQSSGIRGRVGGLRPGRPMTVSRLTAGPVGLGSADLPASLKFETEPWPGFLFAGMKSGSVRLGRPGRAESCGKGDIVLAIRPGRPCHAQTVDAEIVFAGLHHRAVQTVTGGQRPVRFLTGRPRSEAAAAQWETTVDYVAATLQASIGAAEPELVVGSAIRLLAATALHVFPNTYADTESGERTDGAPPMLRRAIDFMHANCARDISMADVANAINVTPRAVQYMFRRHLNVSPMTHLRRIRLSRAHHDLLAADPARDTVAAIALRWGFAHTGRFSQVYRAEYGESPSVTLRG